MSYARWGCDGSDVYVFGTGDGLVCMHMDDGSFACETVAEMLAHLREHRAAGEMVPEYTMKLLEDECR